MAKANAQGGTDGPAELDMLMDTSRIITAAVVRSLASVGTAVTVPQLRVLALLTAHGSTNLTSIAARLGVNASNASRTCEQLVAIGLLGRTENVEDRRHVDLSLTAAGRRLLRDLMERREQLLSQVLVEMSEASRRRLTSALRDFNRAAQSATWSLGGPSEHSPDHSADAQVLPWLT